MTAPVYRIQGLRQNYNGRTVLEVEDWNVAPGAIVGLVGPNGSGKSTLMRLLAFAERPAGGRILFRGRPAGPMAGRVRGRVTLLPQEPYLLKRSVFDNVAYGLRIKGRRAGLAASVGAALEQVGLPTGEFAGRSWRELSGGEAQRVALAARLALRPEVLLLDEPTASVDADSAERIKAAALESRRRWGTTLVIASHDWPWLYEACDELLQLYRGRLFGTGMQNIFTGPWRESADGWGRALADGQRLRVPPPPARESVGVVDPLSMRLCADGENGGPALVTLEGTVTRLALVKAGADVAVTVRAADLSLTLRLSGEAVATRRLSPGCRVRFGYPPEAVTWL